MPAKTTAKKSPSTKKVKASPKTPKAKTHTPSKKKEATPKQVLELVTRAGARKAEEGKKSEKKKKSVNSKQPTVKKPTIVPDKPKSEPTTIRVEYVPDTRKHLQGFTSTETEGQVNYEDLTKLPVTRKDELWKQLNAEAGETHFFPLLTKEARRQLRVMRLAEAVTRELVKETKATKSSLYCPYCVSWSKFRQSPYTGYHKCVGCGISTEDYYVKLDNHLNISKK